MTVSISGTGGVTFNDSSVQNTAATGFGFKNRIINGNMVVSQRNAAASVTPASGDYTLDRWKSSASAASKFTVQQNAGGVTAPAGFTNYLGVTSSSAYAIAAGDFFMQSQPIEGFNTADLNWGTANAQTITISFRVYSSLTGTFGGCITNGAETRAYPFTYSVPVANTWTTISVTIAGDTSGTWIGATNGIGMKVFWGLGVGTTYSATAGAWATGNYYGATGAVSVVGTNAATWYVTGVQLEKGSTATSFDYRPYGTELALCQRYYYLHASGSGKSVGIGGYIQSTEVACGVYFPVTMRSTPTLSAASGTGYYTAAQAAADVFNSFTAYQISTTCSFLYNSTEASGTSGGSAYVYTNNASASVAFTAEL